MITLFEIIKEITYDAFYGFAYFIKINLVAFANVLNFVIPYLMYFVGVYVANGKISIDVIGYEILIPLGFAIVIHYLKGTADKLGRGTKIPVPEARFTSVDGDGEASIENNRIQELILYMADLEDWMERKGLL